MCYSLWYNARTMLPADGRQHSGCIITQALKTQYSAPEDGRNHRPKHVELIGIINKPLLLYLVGCLYYMNLGEQSSYSPSVEMAKEAGIKKI